MASSNRSNRSLSLAYPLIKQWKNDRSFFLAICAVIIIAVFFRFYNYFDRLVILADNSRDAQISLYAASSHLMPQIGPFSQAPFFFGPWWYWFLGLGYLIFPFTLLTPWLLTSVMSVAFVVLMFWLGKEIGGKWFGIMAAFLAAISPAAINNYFSIWNPTAIPFLVLLENVFLFRFYKYKNAKDLIFLGFIFSLATTIHFQSFITIPVLITALFFSKNKVRHCLYLLPAVLIPFLPFIYFDLRYDWFWLKSAVIYLAVDQPTIHIPNRWLTYVFSYWPHVWGSVIGGGQHAGGLLLALTGIFCLAKLKKIKENKALFLISAPFLIEVILFRYYKGERLIYYSFFTHPLIIILTSWTILQVFKLNKYLALILLGIITIATLINSVALLKDITINFDKVNLLKYEIYSAYPNGNFDIYGCKNSHGSYSKPLSLSMYKDKRSSIEGTKIEVCETSNSYEWRVLSQDDFHPKSTFTHDTTNYIYNDNIEWFKDSPPSAGKNFWKFIIRKMNPKCWPSCE